jgi:transposase-like protein
MENIEENADKNIKTSINSEGKTRNTKERPKCPNCKKVLKYEQNYMREL